MRYLTFAVQTWLDEERAQRANAEIALHCRDARRFARESRALRRVLSQAAPGTSFVLHVAATGEALLVKQ
jgi:hypothetical protein